MEGVAELVRVQNLSVEGDGLVPIGQSWNNFPRVVDGTVDSAFDIIQNNTDPVVRKRQIESIVRQYAQKAYEIPLWNQVWSVAYGNNVTPNLETAKLLASDQPAPLIPLGHVVDFTNVTKN